MSIIIHEETTTFVHCNSNLPVSIVYKPNMCNGNITTKRQNNIHNTSSNSSCTSKYYKNNDIRRVESQCYSISTNATSYITTQKRKTETPKDSFYYSLSDISDFDLDDSSDYEDSH